jgi:hypothetical protein
MRQSTITAIRSYRIYLRDAETCWRGPMRSISRRTKKPANSPCGCSDEQSTTLRGDLGPVSPRLYGAQGRIEAVFWLRKKRGARALARYVRAG